MTYPKHLVAFPVLTAFLLAFSFGDGPQRAAATTTSGEAKEIYRSKQSTTARTSILPENFVAVNADFSLRQDGHAIDEIKPSPLQDDSTWKLKKEQGSSFSHITKDIFTDASLASSSCASMTSCEACYTSEVCHWCADNACHAKGSVHGCLEGKSCQNGSRTVPTPSPSLVPDNHKNASNACRSHTTCDECYKSSYECHWCKDHQCHAIGSIHGCIEGEKCPLGPTVAPTTYPPSSKACGAHNNCTECALSSWGCHWCAFDDKCHAIGSIYGCVTGVNCYANNRCQRTTPEKVPQFFTVPPSAAVVCLTVVAVGLCCLTSCFCIAGAAKGAYDDLAILSLQSSAISAAGVADQTLLLETGRRSSRPARHSSSVSRQSSRIEGAQRNGTRSTSMEMTNVLSDNENYDTVQEEEEEVRSLGDANSTEPKHHNHKRSGGHNDDASSLTQSLLPEQSPSWAILEDEEICEAEESRFRVSPMLLSKAARSSSANCLYGCCKICYMLSALCVLVLAFFSMYYFPRVPQYNMCSNQFDWKSIVDAMTSMKVEGSFQLLLSIHNPNRFDIDLGMGSGKFSHQNNYVGSFQIPPTRIAAQSISDLLVTTTFTPDKWEALSLTTEYYRGKLTFVVASSVTVSSPLLGGYTYNVKFDDYFIRVSDVNTDRSLCACPQWEDVKPKKKKKKGPKS